MTKANDPAFPQNVDNKWAMNGECLQVGPLKGGLSRREFIAAMVLQGIVHDSRPAASVAASYAVEYADALIDKLSKAPDGEKESENGKAN